MPKKVRPGDEVIDQMRAMRTGGLSYGAIAGMVGLTAPTVKKYTKDIEVPLSVRAVQGTLNPFPSPTLVEKREKTEELALDLEQAKLGQELKAIKSEDVPKEVLQERADVEITELALRKAEVNRKLRKLQEVETQEAELKELKEKTLKRKRWIRDWQQRILNQIPPEIFMFDDLEKGLKLAIDHQLKHRTEEDDPQRIETNLLQMSAFITHRYYVANKLPIPQL